MSVPKPFQSEHQVGRMEFYDDWVASIHNRSFTNNDVSGCELRHKHLRISRREAAYAAPPFVAIFATALVLPFEVAFCFDSVRARFVFALHLAVFAFCFAANETP